MAISLIPWCSCAFPDLQGNLESYSLRPTPCDTGTAVDLLLQVARGMGWLHAHGGLVHGDLKVRRGLGWPAGLVWCVGCGLGRGVGGC